MADAWSDDGPYVGPRPFDPAERGRFFGRDQESRSIASLVVAHRVVLLYAASGAGKTSLLNAGVIPLLEDEDGFEVLPPVRLRGLAMSDARENPYLVNVLANLARDLSTGSNGAQAAPSSLAEFLAARPRPPGDDALPAPRALIFDQFEELFTLYPERWAQRGEVFDEIRAALEQDPLLRVVLAVREDFIAQLDAYASLLPGGLRTRIRLEPLRRPAALAAVTGPLAGERRSFAPGTAERLVDDLLKVRVHTLRDESTEVPGELVEPVQLQVVCRTLWSSLPADVIEIGDAELARIGSVSDVLSGYYREAVRAAALAGGIAENELRDRLEEAFITPVGTRGTVVGAGELTAGIPNAAIAELEARHLVRAEWRAGARWFELTHDSLIGPILSSNSEVRRVRQARRERLLKQAVASLVAVALLLAALLGVTRGTGTAGSHSAELGVLEASGTLSGLRLKRTLAASASPVLVRTVAGGRGLLVGGSDGRIRVWDLNAGREITTLDYGDSGLSSVDLSPAGRELLAAGRLGLRRWTTAGVGTRPPDTVRFTGENDRSTGLSKAPVTAAEFDPTGSVLLLLKGGRARLSDRRAYVTSGALLFDRTVVRVSYSPVGSAVAGVGADGTALLHGVRTGGSLPPYDRPPVGAERVLAPRGIVSAAFSSDGAQLVTASDDGVARVWRTRNGTLVRELRGDGSPLTDAEFAPGGSLVATAARNGLVRVWSAAGDRLAVVRASTGPVAAVAFGAGGQLLVTAAADARVRVWTTVAPIQPVASTTCGAADYYAPAGEVPESGALASDGRDYVAGVVCTARPGSVVHAPEGGVVAVTHDLFRQMRVELSTPTGRTWVFRNVRPRRGLGTVAAGAAIGSAGRAPGTAVQGIGVELWETRRGGHRLGNLWNPLLFLDVTSSSAAGYPGDTASRAAIARWMGRAAALAGLPPELPVMAALVESNLTNVGGPDADSAGFFLMRQSIWDSGPYAGFAQHPELQLKWFVEHAAAERSRRIAQGRRDPVARSSDWGLWVADIERPPEQFRGRYQLRLGDARALLGPAPPIPLAIVPPPVELPAAPAAPAEAVAPVALPAAPSPAVRRRALQAALSVLGTRYTWGGTTPAVGFDSGGLVQWAYGRAGVQLPRIAEEDARVGKPVTRKALRPGDLVLFADSTGYIHHIGIYVSGGRFVHAPHTGDVVKISSLSEPYYAQEFAGGRRVD